MANSTDNTKILEQVDFLVRGDTVVWNLLFQDALCVPIDTLGWEFYVVLRTHPPAWSAPAVNSAEYQCTNLDDIQEEATVYVYRTILNDPVSSALGEASVTILSNETALIPAGLYFMELKRVIPGSPPDVLTFYSSAGASFEVKDGTVLDVVNE